MPRQPNQNETQISWHGFLPVRSGQCYLNTREDLTSRSLFQASSGLDGYMNFPGLTQSLFHHDLGTKGGRLERKGRVGRNDYGLILWRTASAFSRCCWGALLHKDQSSQLTAPHRSRNPNPGRTLRPESYSEPTFQELKILHTSIHFYQSTKSSQSSFPFGLEMNKKQGYSLNIFFNWRSVF